jgi:hypothetical protein
MLADIIKKIFRLSEFLEEDNGKFSLTRLTTLMMSINLTVYLFKEICDIGIVTVLVAGITGVNTLGKAVSKSRPYYGNSKNSYKKTKVEDLGYNEEMRDEI